MSDPRDRDLVSRLKRIIAQIIDAHRDDDKISPEEIAADVLDVISPAMMREAADLEIRQLSRGMLRREFDPDHDERERRKREPLFPDFVRVQRRYPAADGSGYIKVEVLPEKDWAYNVRRLRRTGSSIIAHSEDLNGWGKAYRDWTLPEDDTGEEGVEPDIG